MTGRITTVVLHEQEKLTSSNHQVLVIVVVQVDKQCAPRVIQPVDARFPLDACERAIWFV